MARACQLPETICRGIDSQPISCIQCDFTTSRVKYPDIQGWEAELLSKSVTCLRAPALYLLICSPSVAIAVAQTRPAQDPATPSITGSISGTVSSDAGNPVTLLPVVAYRRWSAGASSTPAQTIAVTDSTGKYAFSSLESGSYLVCVIPNDTAYVDPCAWSAHPPVVNLNAGQSANLDIALPVAASVYADVADPDKAVSSFQQKAPGGHAFLLKARGLRTAVSNP
jgi:hypothetical protein